MISVVLADDQPLLREGIRTILDAQADIRVVAEAGDGRSATEACVLRRPDVVLMDIEMPGGGGIAATSAVVRGSPRTRILMLTTFDREEYVFEALRAGATGFLLKTVPAPELIAAVRAAAQGDALLSPEITRRLISTYVQRPAPTSAAANRVAELTPRESEVLLRLASGASNAEIAGQLVVSEATIKTHINRLFAKLDVRDRAQAVILAYEAGLVRPTGREPPLCA